ncbi:MAG TPA: hypothetical protein VFK06_07115 [Candidatus Angelobacter sp.]|nr:hypothetical protein [Candidatus Angelobacter sp.]
MTVQTAVSAIFFIVGIGCIIRVNLLFSEIVVEINRLLPAERAISLAGFARHQFFEILAEYKRLYPGGKLVLRLSIWSAVGFACLFGSAGYWFFSGEASTGYIPRTR